MIGTTLHRRIAPILVATVMALSASIAMAQGDAESSSDDADPSNDVIACRFVGCGDGNRLCGYVSWQESYWLPTTIPLLWSFTHTATCYESMQQ